MTVYGPTGPELLAMRSDLESTLTGAVTVERPTAVRDDRGGHTETVTTVDDADGLPIHRARWHAVHYRDDLARVADQNRPARQWRVVLTHDSPILAGDLVTIPGVVTRARASSAAVGVDGSFGIGTYTVIDEDA